MSKKWKEAQEWEKEWHGDCANSYNEETKQYDYASKMGLNPYYVSQYGICGWDFGDKTVLDVGGGAYSILLKSKAKRRVVIDPCNYPNWIKIRYDECGIEYIKELAEHIGEIKKVMNDVFDIVLCYNVLQHVEDPEKIIKSMMQCSKTIHFFDWLEIGVGQGHIHNLHRIDLDRWLGGRGKVEPATRGFSYAGVFKGEHYE